MQVTDSSAALLATEEPAVLAPVDLQFKGYMPGLDRLRGIAILLVLVHHGVDSRLAWAAMSGPARYLVYLTSWGRTGVHLFFVLSGFLITGILVDTKERPDYWTRFYRNRALRILPAYLLMLVVLKMTGEISWRFVLAALLYIANMAKLVGARLNEYGSFWSLAVEEQFYLIWPLAIRRLSLSALTRVIVAIVIVSPILFLTAEILGATFDIRFKLWGNACWLLSGALIAVTLRTKVLNRSNIMKLTWSLVAVSAVMLPVVAYAELNQAANSWTHYAAAENVRFIAIMPVYCALLLHVIATNRAKWARTVNGPIGKALSFLGYVSYGLYLVNWFVFTQCDSFLNGTQFRSILRDPSWVMVTFVPYSLLAVGIAFLSRRYIEDRFLKLKAGL